MKNDPRSCERNSCNCIRLQDFKGIWSSDLVMPVWCSDQLRYKANDVGSWSTMCSYFHVQLHKLRSLPWGSFFIWFHFHSSHIWFISYTFVKLYLFVRCNAAASIDDRLPPQGQPHKLAFNPNNPQWGKKDTSSRDHSQLRHSTTIVVKCCHLF